MNYKTIWYCHPTAGFGQTSMSYRPYFLAKYWKKMGHQPYVIGSSFHHLLKNAEAQKESIQPKNIENVDYIVLKTLKYKSNGIKRILSMLSYSLRLITNRKQILSITSKPDVIIVSSTHPFHYFPLYYFAKKNNIPLIFEVRDLWPSSLIALLKLKSWHPLVLFLSVIEKHAYKHADKVVSLLELAKPYMESHGLNPTKFHYIPNGTEPSFQNNITLPSEHLNLIQKLKENNAFIIGYTGAMGTPNALSYLIEAMILLQETHPHIHCVLVGDGHEKQTLKNEVNKHKLKNVHFLPSIPKNMIQSFLKKMDLLYIGWQDTKLYQYGVSPNKIFDYMQSGIPIIESGGAPVSLTSKANCGLNCEAANPEKIAQAIIEIMQKSTDEKKEMGQNGKFYVQQYHHYQILAQEFLKVMNL